MRDTTVTICEGEGRDAHWYVMTGDGTFWRDWFVLDMAVDYARELLELYEIDAVPFVRHPVEPLVEPFTNYRVVRREPCTRS